MTVEQTPARPPLGPTQPDLAPGAPPPYRWQGHLLSVGAASWAVVSVVTAGAPTDRAGKVALALTSGTYQLGLLALLLVLDRTRALGPGRLARFFVWFEVGLVCLALCATTADGLGVPDGTRAPWAMLDATWPLSMIGMLCIGIRIAIAGCWRGVTRWWPLVAGSWFLVVIPTVAVVGQGKPLVGIVSGLHLLFGYTVLGQLLARKRS